MLIFVRCFKNVIIETELTYETITALYITDSAGDLGYRHRYHHVTAGCRLRWTMVYGADHNKQTPLLAQFVAIEI